MKKILYILPILVIMSFYGCDYIKIGSPKKETAKDTSKEPSIVVGKDTAALHDIIDTAKINKEKDRILKPLEDGKKQIDSAKKKLDDLKKQWDDFTK
jgi:hypothetical protein